LVKSVVLVFLIIVNLSAYSLEGQIVSLLGKGNYRQNRGLIEVLFKDKAAFLKNGKADLAKVSKVLKENNLLHLSLPRRMHIQLSFATKERNSLLFIKLVKEVLSSAGYSNTLTTKAQKDSSGFLWQVDIVSSSMIDPSLIAGAFDTRGATVTKIKRVSPSNYRYDIDIRGANVKAISPPINQELRLKKPLNPYWIRLGSARSAKIVSLAGNRWHPYVVFYDSNLKILGNYTKAGRSYNITLKVPRGASYLKIADLYTLQNIKRGLKITLVK